MLLKETELEVNVCCDVCNLYYTKKKDIPLDTTWGLCDRCFNKNKKYNLLGKPKKKDLKSGANFIGVTNRDIKCKVKFLNEKQVKARRFRRPGLVDGHECSKCPLKGSNCKYRQYKDNAKKRFREFSLTVEYFWEMVKLPCRLCGCTPKPGKFNGIDRWDNTQGYSVANCVTMCGQCNMAKGRNSPEEFNEWFMRVYKFNNE